MNELKRRREELNLTQAQVAEAANMSEKQYWRVERGYQEPSVKRAILIADKLESEVKQLFGAVDKAQS